MNEERDSKIFVFENAIHGGLLGICIVGLLQLTSAPDLSLALKVATYCFVVSAPCLGTALAVDMTYTRKGLTPSSHGLALFASGVGQIGSIVGISAVAFHFSWVHAVIFAALVLVGFITWYRC